MAKNPQKFKPCSLEITLDLNNDILVWDNTDGASDCIATFCMPALEKDSYFIPAFSAVSANPANRTTDPRGQSYKCVCGRLHIEGDPKLIVR